MGIFYLVDPFDDDEREWLSSEGVALPPRGRRGRNPTPAEIREVCDALEGFRVTYNSSAKIKFWQATIEGTKGPNRKRGTLLNIDKWGGSEQRRYKVAFEKGDPTLILEIVHGLSARCGPLVITPDCDTPVVAWAEADLQTLLREWEHTRDL